MIQIHERDIDVCTILHRAACTAGRETIGILIDSGCDTTSVKMYTHMYMCVFFLS